MSTLMFMPPDRAIDTSFSSIYDRAPDTDVDLHLAILAHKLRPASSRAKRYAVATCFQVGKNGEARGQGYF